jgi:hypothetical protein
MNWRNRPPRVTEYDSAEDFYEALESFEDALYDDADSRYEERMLGDD